MVVVDLLFGYIFRLVFLLINRIFNRCGFFGTDVLFVVFKLFYVINDV